MTRSRALAGSLFLVLCLTAIPADAQYATGHRRFGVGTALGGGFSRYDFRFKEISAEASPNDVVDAKKDTYFLFPTIELKFFLSDTLSLDLSVPVVNIAASNALQKYFFFQSELFLGFHPSAPQSSVELFIAPGIGFSYASFSDENGAFTVSSSGYAFHVPVRVGLEFNNARRNFSFIVSLRPFFALVHANKYGTSFQAENKPGGGCMVELGFMAYSVGYQSDRY